MRSARASRALPCNVQGAAARVGRQRLSLSPSHASYRRARDGEVAPDAGRPPAFGDRVRLKRGTRTDTGRICNALDTRRRDAVGGTNCSGRRAMREWGGVVTADTSQDPVAPPWLNLNVVT